MVKVESGLDAPSTGMVTGNVRRSSLLKDAVGGEPLRTERIRRIGGRCAARPFGQWSSSSLPCRRILRGRLRSFFVFLFCSAPPEESRAIFPLQRNGLLGDG